MPDLNLRLAAVLNARWVETSGRFDTPTLERLDRAIARLRAAGADPEAAEGLREDAFKRWGGDGFPAEERRAQMIDRCHRHVEMAAAHRKIGGAGWEHYHAEHLRLAEACLTAAANMG